MKKLFLLRHAESSPATTMIDDIERPLSARGVEQVKGLALNLNGIKVQPRLITYSNAKRTTQTTQLFLQHMKLATVSKAENQLYLCELEPLLEFIFSIDDEINELMIVAHNPSLQDFLLHFCESANYEKIMLAGLPTCGFAVIEAENLHKWSDFSKQHISNIKLIF
jgi:phosphohistidine phosphatase